MPGRMTMFLCVGITLWAALPARGQTLKVTLKGHTDTVNSVAFSPDGKTIASASDDKTIKLWEVLTGKLRTTLKGHADAVNSVCFSPDGKTLASASDDKTIKLWDAKTGTVKATLKQRDPGLIRPASVCFSRNGKLLACATCGGGSPGLGRGRVYVWDVKTRQRNAILESPGGYVNCVAFSPDGKTLALADLKGQVYFWEVATMKRRGQIKPPTANSGATATWICYSPDGKTLAVINDFNAFFSAPPHISLLNPLTGKLFRTIPGHPGQAHPSSVLAFASICFSPDGKTLASSNYAETTKLWDAKTGKAKATLPGPGGFITSLQFSPNGKLLIAATDTIQLWDVSKLK